MTNYIAIYKKSEGGGDEDTRAEVNLSWSGYDVGSIPDCNATVGEEFTAPTLVVTGKDGNPITASDVIYGENDIYYMSMDPAYATVTADGTVTPVAEGTASIRVYVSSKSTNYKPGDEMTRSDANGKFISYNLNVTQNKTPLTFDPVDDITLAYGEAVDVPVITADGNVLTTQDGLRMVVNVVGTANVAYIDYNDNKIKTYRAGEAELVISLVSDVYVADPLRVKITVSKADVVFNQHDALTLRATGSAALAVTAKINGAEGTLPEGTLSYTAVTSNDGTDVASDVITVDANGVVTAVTAGTAYVKVFVPAVTTSYESKESMYVPVTVSLPKLTLAFDRTEAEASLTDYNPAGVLPRLVATDEDGNVVTLSDSDVAYTSSNSNVIGFWENAPTLYQKGEAYVTASLTAASGYEPASASYHLVVRGYPATINAPERIELDIDDPAYDMPEVTVTGMTGNPDLVYAAVASNDGTDTPTEVFELEKYYGAYSVISRNVGTAYVKVTLNSNRYEAEPVYIEVVVTEKVASATFSLAGGSNAGSVEVYRNATALLGAVTDGLTVDYAGWGDTEGVYVVAADGFYLTSVTDADGNDLPLVKDVNSLFPGRGDIFYVTRAASKSAYTVATIPQLLDPTDGMIDWTRPTDLSEAGGATFADGDNVTTAHRIQAKGTPITVYFNTDVTLAGNSGVEMPVGSHMVVSADDPNVNFNSITFAFDGDVTLDAGGNGTLENGVWTAPAPAATQAAYGPMQAPEVSGVRSVTFTNGAETPARVKTMTINYTSTTTGIEQTETVVVAEPVYFDLQGRRVDNPTPGLYIRVTGDRTDKVLVK